MKLSPDKKRIVDANFPALDLYMLKCLSTHEGLPEDALPWLVALNNEWFKAGDKKVGNLKSKYIGPLKAKGFVAVKKLPAGLQQVDITGADEKVLALLKTYQLTSKDLDRHWKGISRKNTPKLHAPDDAVCPVCEGPVGVEKVANDVGDGWRPFCGPCDLHGRLAETAEKALEPWRAKNLGMKGA